MVRDFFRINMPYVIEKVDEFGGEWVVLNRDYAPLGYPKSAGLKWKLFPQEYLRLKRITAYKINQLKRAGAKLHKNEETGAVQKIYLYNDAAVPVDRLNVKLNKSNWDRYCKLLEILATIKTN